MWCPVQRLNREVSTSSPNWLYLAEQEGDTSDEGGWCLSGQAEGTSLHPTQTHNNRTQQEPSLPWVSTNSTFNLTRHQQLFPVRLFALGSCLHCWCSDNKPTSGICADLRFVQINRATDISKTFSGASRKVWQTLHGTASIWVGSHDVWRNHLYPYKFPFSSVTSESEFQPQKKVKCPFVDEEIIQVKQQHSEMLSWCSFDTYSIGWQGKENLPF